MNDNLTSIQIEKALRAELNLEKALLEREHLHDVNYSELLVQLLQCWREHRPNAARPAVASVQNYSLS